MNDLLQNFESFPLYAAFFGTALGLLTLGLTIYLWITPYHELRLIKAGNRAAAISFSGAAFGLALPLHAIANSTWQVLELAAWGVVALIVQLLVFLAVAFLLGDLRKGIEEDRVGYGIILGSFSFIVGLVNSAAIAS